MMSCWIFLVALLTMVGAVKDEPMTSSWCKLWKQNFVFREANILSVNLTKKIVHIHSYSSKKNSVWQHVIIFLYTLHFRHIIFKLWIWNKKWLNVSIFAVRTICDICCINGSTSVIGSGQADQPVDHGFESRTYHKF